MQHNTRTLVENTAKVGEVKEEHVTFEVKDATQHKPLFYFMRYWLVSNGILNSPFLIICECNWFLQPHV